MNGIACRLDYGSHRGRQAAPGHRPSRRDRGRPRRGDRQGLLRRFGGLDRTTPGTTTEAQAPAGAVVVTGRVLAGEGPRCSSRRSRRSTRARCTVNGHPVFVKGENVSSGAGLDRLKAGTLQPVIWTPSSSLWGRLLTQTADVTWVPRQNVSMFRTPLVIAMWEDQAQALGWPAKQLGWADILAESKNTQGWAKYGHPEWGPFRLGHTNPDFSTSGLSAVAAEYYAATGKTEGLTLQDVEDPDRARPGARHPVVGRPLRRHDAVLRGAARGARPGVRVGRRDGGDDARRLQRPPPQGRQAPRRDLSRRRGRSSPTTR